MRGCMLDCAPRHQVVHDREGMVRSDQLGNFSFPPRLPSPGGGNEGNERDGFLDGRFINEII